LRERKMHLAIKAMPGAKRSLTMAYLTEGNFVYRCPITRERAECGSS
jgi:hypothetical protein